MYDPRPSVAIIGAGPSGLAAAHHLAESHQVWLFDSRDSIGGVWALDSHQAYPWLETNTPSALFAFPGFSLKERDWKGRHGKYSKDSAYVTAEVAQRYILRFAKVKRLDKDGRLRSLKLQTKVTRIQRLDGAKSTDGTPVRSGWMLNFVDNATSRSQATTFDKVIVATGSFSVPAYPKHLEGAFDFHSSSIGSLAFEKRLLAAHKVVIVGGGKSALDLIAYINRLSAGKRPSILLVLPPHQLPSALPAPYGKVASYLSRLSLLGSCHLSPWAGTLSCRKSTWLEGSIFGKYIRRAYWSLLGQQIQRSYESTLQSSSSLAWRDMMRFTSRLFPAPHGLGLVETRAGLNVTRASISSIHTDESQNTTVLSLTSSKNSRTTVTIDAKVDLMVACTGYHSSASNIASLFDEHSEARRMGIPVASNDNNTKKEASWRQRIYEEICDAHRREPILEELFSKADFTAESLDTYALYHLMIPLDQAYRNDEQMIPRNLAVMGLPQTLSATIVADVQARWIAAFFSETSPASSEENNLHLPICLNEAEEKTACLVAASLSRYGPRDARQGTTMSLELSWYATLLLLDLKKRKEHPKDLLHPFRTLRSDDFL